MAEYVGIKVGKLHETTEMSEYYCARCGYPVTDHDSFCRECGGAFQRGPASEPCDRDALLELADEIWRNADLSRELVNDMLDQKRLDMALTFHEHACELREYAERIREVLGVEG